MKRAIWLQATLVLVCSMFPPAVAQQEATVIVSLTSDGAPGGFWLVQWPSGQLTKIHDDWPRPAVMWQPQVVFSPDGRKIAYKHNGTFHIMNNDGTGIVNTGVSTGYWDCYGSICWTTSGIFWTTDDKLHRYIPEIDSYSIVEGFDFSHPLGSQIYCNENHGCPDIWMSHDGRKMFSMAAYDGPIDGYYCGHQFGRSNHPYIAFSADFSSWTVVGWTADWGHGQLMSRDGYMMFIQKGEHRSWNPVTWFDDNTLEYAWGNGNGMADASETMLPAGTNPGINPPYPATIEIEGVTHPREGRVNGKAANNDSILVSNTNAEHYPTENTYLYNWKSLEFYGEVAKVPGGYNQIGHSVWWGPLPGWTDDPYLSVTPSTRTFVVEGQTAPPDQQVTVTNLSTTQTLGQVSAAVSTPGADWLTATVEGSGGDTQDITIAILPLNLTQDVSSAVVAVSGGGATNEATFTVTVYRGDVLPVPGNLSVEASGDSLLFASLSWEDNATTESGFIVERSEDGGAWSEVHRSAADATSWTDESAPDYVPLVYRVKAFSDLGGGVIQESEPSSEAAITIVGIPWIRVSRPMAGEFVRAGSEYVIRWDANMVETVRIDLSTNLARTWEELTALGGISTSSADWGTWTWTVPDIEQDSALIKVMLYQGGVDGRTDYFTISSTLSGASLPAGNFTHLLQLENASGGAGAEVLAQADATSIEARYDGSPTGFPCDDEAFTVNGNDYAWHARTDSDGMWADGTVDNFTAYWAVTIVSPDARTVRLRNRQDDDLTIWRNGTAWFTRTGWDNGSELESTDLSLEAGENRMLIKLQEGTGDNHFAGRLVTVAGEDITDLFYDLPSCNSPSTRSPLASMPGAGAGVTLKHADGRLVLGIDAPLPFRIRIIDSAGRVVGYARGTGPSAALLPWAVSRAGVYVVSGTVGDRTVNRRVITCGR